MTKPLEQLIITQTFGARPDYYAQFGLKGHDGIDYKTKGIGGNFFYNLMGWQPVKAVTDGLCTVTYNHPAYGNFIDLKDTQGNIYRYAHLKNARPPKPDSVLPGSNPLMFLAKEGEIIGITGSSGNVSGPHLHFGYRPKGYDVKNGYFGFVDPMQLFQNSTQPVDFHIVYLSDTEDLSDDVAYCNQKLKEFTGGLLGLTMEFKQIPAITSPTNFDLDQFQAMAIVDSQVYPNKFHGVVLGHYGQNVSEGFSTYISQKNIIMTQGYKPFYNIGLLFEIKHQLNLWYNSHRGTNPFISRTDVFSLHDAEASSLLIAENEIKAYLPYLPVFAL